MLFPSDFNYYIAKEMQLLTSFNGVYYDSQNHSETRYSDLDGEVDRKYKDEAMWINRILVRNSGLLNRKNNDNHFY